MRAEESRREEEREREGGLGGGKASAGLRAALLAMRSWSVRRGEQGCEGLAAGLWHYLPTLHRLVHLGPARVQPSAASASSTSRMT